MPTEILEQLKTLRAGVAESLKKDPRYLTLTALDKSIAEIGGVLAAAGLVSAEAAKAPAPLSFGDEPAAKNKAKASAKPAGLLDSSSEAETVDAEDGDEGEDEGEDDEDPEPASAEAEEGDDEPETAEADDEAAAETDVAEAEDEGDEDESEDAGEAAGDGDEPKAAHPAKLGSLRGGAGESVIPEGKSSGYKAMAAKPDAAQYQPGISVKYGKLPNKVDLRPLMTPVENQGQTNSCVANAVAGAWEYWVKRATRKETDVSRLFVYYNARWRDGSQDKDEGSVIQLAMESLSKFGACAEKAWPFDKRLIFKKPGGDAYKDAATNRVQDMARVPLVLEAWKQALAEGKPIVFGCALFGSFDEACKRGGVVPMPSPQDLGRASHGGHAMCAVGYSDAEKVFIVRNSWGSEWGDKGYCYMPYDYLMNPKFNFGDSWVFVPKVPLPPPRDVWFEDNDPVTNDGKGVTFVISPYSIADYVEVTIDLFVDLVVPYNETVRDDFAQYVSFAERSEWSSFEQFDVTTYLETTEITEETIVTEETEETEEEVEETEETEEDSEEETDDEDSDEDESEDESDDGDEEDDEDGEEDDSEDDDGGDEGDEEEDSEDDDGGDEGDEEGDSEDDDGGDEGDEEEDSEDDDGGDEGDEEEDSEDDDGGDEGDEEEDSEDDDGGDEGDEEEDSEDDDGGDDEGDEEEDSEDDDGGDEGDEEEDSEDDDGGDEGDEEEDSEDDDGGDEGDEEEDSGDDGDDDGGDDDGGDDEGGDEEEE